jgi:diketogulonate reductase-like aldo/keto reductase
MAQGEDVVPIPGSRRHERIAENAAAIDVHLSAAALKRLDAEVPPEAWAGDRRSFAVPPLALSDDGNPSAVTYDCWS